MYVRTVTHVNAPCDNYYFYFQSHRNRPLAAAAPDPDLALVASAAVLFLLFIRRSEQHFFKVGYKNYDDMVLIELHL